jgi:hypothetical protein
VKDRDRLAAEWVLSIGGTASVDTSDSQGIPIDELGKLPDNPFVLTSVDLSLNPRVTDDDLTNLRGLEQLRTIDLQRTAITDRGLAILTDDGRQPLINLDDIQINDTTVTQTGLSYLADSKKLSVLNI